MSSPPSSLAKADYERLANFRYRLRQFLRRSEDLCRQHGLTPLQYQMLLQIAGCPDREWMNIAELAERLQAKHHGMVALVSRCETLGLVERRLSTADRRQVEVHLTPKGRAALETLARLHVPERRALRRAFSVTGWERDEA